MATRCDPGGFDTANKTSRSLYLSVNCRQAAAAISLPLMDRISQVPPGLTNRRLSEDTSRSTGAIPACALKAHFGMRLRKLRTFEAFRAKIVSIIQSEGRPSNLSSAIRAFVLEHYRSKIDSMATEH